MKTLLLRFVFFSLLTTSTSTMALDIVTSPIQIFTKPCSNYLRYGYASAFCFSQKLSYSMVGNGKGHGDMKLFAFILALPFTILDEENERVQMNTKLLADQGYTEEEIFQYKTDLELVEVESEKEKINNSEDAIRLLESLVEDNQIHQSTIEIMGL